MYEHVHGKCTYYVSVKTAKTNSLEKRGLTNQKVIEELIEKN